MPFELFERDQQQEIYWYYYNIRKATMLRKHIVTSPREK